jgi:CRP/FNR family transcriptional regulator
MTDVNEIRARFPDLYEQELLDRIAAEGDRMELKEGDLLMDIGGYIKRIPLVMDGLLKVLREDEDGNEMLLYFIGPGQTCAMALTCCMGAATSTVRVVAEEDSVVVTIPARIMDELTNDFRSWKTFVMHTYQQRFDDLLRTIDGIAFRQLDVRLMELLQGRVRASGRSVVELSHQALAQELNTAREVVSRILKQMERKGLVKLGRQRIEVLEPAAAG